MRSVPTVAGKHTCLAMSECPPPWAQVVGHIFCFSRKTILGEFRPLARSLCLAAIRGGAGGGCASGLCLVTRSLHLTVHSLPLMHVPHAAPTCP